MPRLIAAVLISLLALTLVSAQEEDKPVRLPMGGARTSYLPFEVIDVDGKAAWKVNGRGAVKVEDLIGGLATALGKRVALTTKGAGAVRATVAWYAPDAGMVIGNADLLEFVNEILGASNLVVVGMSGAKGTLAGFDEAAPFAPFVTAAEVDSLVRGEWATVAGEIKHADRDGVHAAVQPSVGREGITFAMFGNQFVTTGPAEQVQKLLRVIEAVDRPGASYRGEVVKSYTLPGGVQAEAAAAQLRALFAQTNRTVTDLEGKFIVREDNTPSAHIAVLSGNRVLVRANSVNQSLVAAAIAEMK